MSADTKLLAETIESIVGGAAGTDGGAQHLCLDKGYDNPTGREAAGVPGPPHIRRIGEEKAVKREEETQAPTLGS